MNLEGKVAIVTGSGQGVGRGIALYFARQGAKVITNNRRPSNGLPPREPGMTDAQYAQYCAMKGDAEDTARLIRAEGGKASACFADVCRESDAERLIKTTVDTYGRIDILINNAAGLGQGTLTDTTDEQWDYMTTAKMKGAFHTMRAAVPYMKAQGSGCILNCASNAWCGIPNLTAYSAGNAGVVGLTKAAAKELAPLGITVNAYCPQAASPGHIVEFTKTVESLVEKLGESARPDAAKMREVEKDHGDATHAAPFLAWLCTDAAAKISGSVFGVTGSGRIEYYCEPEIIRTFQTPAEDTDLQAMTQIVQNELLPCYQSRAFGNEWGK